MRSPRPHHRLRSEKPRQEAGGRGFDSRHLHAISTFPTWAFAPGTRPRDTNGTRQGDSTGGFGSRWRTGTNEPRPCATLWSHSRMRSQLSSCRRRRASNQSRAFDDCGALWRQPKREPMESMTCRSPGRCSGSSQVVCCRSLPRLLSKDRTSLVAPPFNGSSSSRTSCWMHSADGRHPFPMARLPQFAARSPGLPDLFARRLAELDELQRAVSTQWEERLASLTAELKGGPRNCEYPSRRSPKASPRSRPP